MQRFQLPDGTIVEQQADGSFLEVLDAGPSPSMTITTQRDPSKDLQDSRTRQQMARDTATLPFDVAKAQADAAKAQAEAAKASKDASKGVSPEERARANQLSATDIVDQIASVRRIIGEGGTTGVTGALGRLVPGTRANDLSALIEGLKGSVLLKELAKLKEQSANGASGFGSLTEREGDRIAGSIAALNVNMSDQELLNQLARLERHTRALTAIQQGQNPDDPEVQKSFGIVPDRPDAAAGVAGQGGGGQGGADGPGGGSPLGGRDVELAQDTTIVTDPARAGMNAEIARRIRAGQSAEEIRAYMNSVQQGLGDATKGLDAAVKYWRANPNWNPQVDVETYEKPLTPAGSILNTVAQSPVGAFTMGAADILSGGNLDSMTSNPELSRLAMQGVAEANPVSTFAGQIGGGALMGLGAELGLARAGVGRLGSMIGADVLPGAFYGAGTADVGNPDATIGDRALGGLGGGMAGLVGGAAGRGIGRAVGGVTDPALRYLNRSGIRLTPGQMAGGMAKRLEDAATSVPFLGDLITSQRRRGIEDFNRAALREAVQPIGAQLGDQVGETGYAAAEDAVSQAYRDALGGYQFTPDAQYLTDAQAATQMALNIPRVGQEVADTTTEIGREFMPGGVMSGENLQGALRSLRDFRSGYRNDPLGFRVGNVVGDYEGAITGMVNRQAPEVMPAFDAANEAYRNVATLRDATNAAVNTEGVFSPAQLGRVARDSTKAFGGRGAAARGDRPFFDLQRYAQDTLPSTLPDSGTARRMMLGAAALPFGLGAAGGATGYASDGGVAEGAGTGAALGALGTLALASPYTARAGIQRILLSERPDAVRRGAQFLTDSRLPGALITVPLVTE